MLAIKRSMPDKLIINIDKLGDDSKAIIDALQVVKDVGDDKDACLKRLDEEIENTDRKASLSSNPEEVDRLLDYRSRLLKAKNSLDEYFEPVDGD